MSSSQPDTGLALCPFWRRPAVLNGVDGSQVSAERAGVAGGEFLGEVRGTEGQEVAAAAVIEEFHQRRIVADFGVAEGGQFVELEVFDVATSQAEFAIEQVGLRRALHG